MIIYIGSDHAGFTHKQFILEHYKNHSNFDFKDFGCFSLDSVDYPDIAKKIANTISNDINNNIISYGILICGTGIGMSIAANKIKNIRCSLIHDLYTAEFTKKHNNPNIIAFGSKIVNVTLSINMINTFFNHNFEAGRHLNRIKKIE
tara:strand:- start:38 stop:478 length:441 start_codon:yes stop_codon:yes gene_type:complete